MIETPTATAFKVDYIDEVDGPLLDQKTEDMTPVEADLFLVKQKPITSKMRTALKHIKSIGGRWAGFRGLHVALIYHVIHGLITNLFESTFSARYRPIIAIITSVVLCRLQMTWTHIVISNPSEKAWYRRRPSIQACKNIIIPTAVLAIAQQAALYVPTVLLVSAADIMIGGDKSQQKVACLQLLLVVLSVIATVVLIIIPADVTLKRVQASMLPDEDESIVPFDRTFGGKVKPEILGGSGAVGMLDAWKTFDWPARLRLVKLYAKIFAIQVTTTIMFFMIVVGELRLIMGDDFAKMLRKAHEHVKPQ